MKPINSKERSKQVWQFIFIFFLMCIVPVALIFFSYHRLPEEISKEEQKKLDLYSGMAHDQKVLIQHISVIDSNITQLALHNATSEMSFTTNIQNAFLKLKNIDPTPLNQAIIKGYEAHYAHVVELNKVRDANSQSTNKVNGLQAELTRCEAEKNSLRSGNVAPVMQPR